MRQKTTVGEIVEIVGNAGVVVVGIGGVIEVTGAGAGVGTGGGLMVVVCVDDARVCRRWWGEGSAGEGVRDEEWSCCCCWCC
jgi:hypothetical protein